jgi:hypothetical protein
MIFGIGGIIFFLVVIIIAVDFSSKKKKSKELKDEENSDIKPSKWNSPDLVDRQLSRFY